MNLVQLVRQLGWAKGDYGNLIYYFFSFSYVVRFSVMIYEWNTVNAKTKTPKRIA